MDFRKVIHDGDLVTEVKVDPFPLLPFFTRWVPYRNESEEARLLKVHRDNALKQFQEMDRLLRVASVNVSSDLDLLKKYKGKNSEVFYCIPTDQSILEEREGNKYNPMGDKRRKEQANRRRRKGKDQRKKQARRVSLMSILSNAEITMPTSVH